MTRKQNRVSCQKSLFRASSMRGSTRENNQETRKQRPLRKKKQLRPSLGNGPFLFSRAQHRTRSRTLKSICFLCLSSLRQQNNSAKFFLDELLLRGRSHLACSSHSKKCQSCAPFLVHSHEQRPSRAQHGDQHAQQTRAQRVLEP